jgi:hypothetical protein
VLRAARGCPWSAQACLGRQARPSC